MTALRGRKILILRAEGQASALAAALEAEGAETIAIPAIAIAPPASFCGLDAALITLRTFDWVVFTSANAVEAFAARAMRLGLNRQASKVAVIGPATARAAVASGVCAEVDLMPTRYVAEGLIEALTPHAAGTRILLVRAAIARDVLPEALVDAGALLTIAEAYRTIVPTASIERLRTLFAANGTDAIAFTSGSTVENLTGLLHAAKGSLPEGIVLASIGPVTSAALRGQGWEPTVEAAEATIAGLVEAVVAGVGQLQSPEKQQD